MSLKTPDGETKNDICKKFNKNIQKLSNKAYVMSKRSMESESIKNKLKILFGDDPFTDAIISVAVTGIYKYRKLIEEKDTQFWEKVDFEKEYGHSEQMKTYGGLLIIIKSKWKSLSEPEIQEIGQIAQDLLEQYKIFSIFELIESGQLDKQKVGFI